MTTGRILLAISIGSHIELPHTTIRAYPDPIRLGSDQPVRARLGEGNLEGLPWIV